MSVVTTVALPAQPGDGETRFIPLGGDGAVSPHSYTTLEMTNTSDASGGKTQAEITFDPRWTQLLAWVGVSVTNSAAAVPVDYAIQQAGAAAQKYRASAALRAIPNFSADNQHLWYPAAELIVTDGSARNVTVAIENIDTQELVVRMLVYNFDRRARERTPIEILAACLVRSGTELG